MAEDKRDRREYWREYHQTPAYKERNRLRMQESDNREAHKFASVSASLKKRIQENKI